MDKKKRIQEIERYVVSSDFASIATIAEHLNISTSTVRRDIREMVDQGMIIQKHGVILSSKTKEERWSDYRQREETQISEKARLGELAAALVHDNDAIFLEGGTTLREMAKRITAKNVTIVTPDLSIAMDLAKNTSVTTIVLGGYIWQGTYLLLGEMAERNIADMHFSHYFTSPGGITEEGALTYYNIQVSGIRSIGRSVSSSLIVVCDDSKFGKAGFVNEKTLAEVDVLITNAIPDHYRNLLSSHTKLILPDD